MKTMNLKDLEKNYSSYRQDKLHGRWITLETILPLVKNLDPQFKVNKLGQSSKKRDILSITFGSGDINILIWTQMHGNESTGTKAVFDLLSFLSNSEKEELSVSNIILKRCKIVLIPILNPDGANSYTRVNANNIDLNRDIIDKKAVETNILLNIVQKVNPHYCFNLHDQRVIFSVGKENNPATLSFLAPSIDEKRSITKSRMDTMKVIVEMNTLLQNLIPNQIGRYTDEFYPTATGDNFQKMGHNTILIESGHYINDYQREKSREYTFYALLQGILTVANQRNNIDFKSYFEIPNNKKEYLDIIIKDVTFKGKKVDIGVLYIEKLVDNTLKLIPTIDKIRNLSKFNANKIVKKTGLNFLNKKDMNDWIKKEFL